MATNLDQLVLHKDQVSLEGLNREGIVSIFRRVLFKPSAWIQSITISHNGMDVEWKGLESDDLAPDLVPENASELLPSLPMEEVDGSVPATAIGQAVMQLEAQGLSVTHTIVGTKSRIWRWLGMDDVTERPEYIGGGQLLAVKGISPEEVYLVGGPSRTSELSDARASIRIFMLMGVV